VVIFKIVGIAQFAQIIYMQVKTHSDTTVVNWLQIILFSGIILYLGKTLFIPLFFGLLIAMAMYPACRWMEKHGLNKPLAITCCMLTVTLLIILLCTLLVWQINVFSKDAKAILHNLESSIQTIKIWITEQWGLSMPENTNWSEQVFNSVSSILKTTVQATISTLFSLLLIPVFMALFMYHRKILVQFIAFIIPAGYRQQLDSILEKTVHTYFNYIKGMILVYLIVGILNSIGLLALGVKHAVLFGMLCAIMTMVPYVGIVISALLPISVVWMDTGNILYPLGVIAMFSFVQYLEANIIFPKVVGTQLHVSTLAILVAIISGGIIWGVAGMVLFIPFIAILKIITDYIDEWKPINLLLSRN
jgi:predicted PurR-regulated permease PerM